MKPLIVSCMLLVAIAAVFAAQPRPYGVTATADKRVDFAKLRTYSWTSSRPSSDKTIDAQIVAATDRELSALGLMKAAAGAVDVLATYSSLTRTDVDLKAKADKTGSQEYAVGVLVIALLDPGTHQPVLQLRIDKPIDTERAKVEAAINSAVAEMFAKYPTRVRK